MIANELKARLSAAGEGRGTNLQPSGGEVHADGAKVPHRGERDVDGRGL